MVDELHSTDADRLWKLEKPLFCAMLSNFLNCVLLTIVLGPLVVSGSLAKKYFAIKVDVRNSTFPR